LQKFRYPARLRSEQDGQTFNVTFRDVPEAITWGRGSEDALRQAADCLEEAIAGRLRRGDTIPSPSKARRGEKLVDVPGATAAKAALYLTMKESGVRASQLARRLKLDEKDVHRMLDPRHATRLSRIEEALRLLGRRLTLSLDEAA
jgi:antitoxin HicB